MFKIIRGVLLPGLLLARTSQHISQKRVENLNYNLQHNKK